ncbi:MAG: hypothetical protein JWN76_1672 [Chitinophagaceae bacterium]|nr:hypothetical protein [Chitinophagaceae bacterium]
MKTLLSLIAIIFCTGFSFHSSGKLTNKKDFVNLSIMPASNYKFEVYKSVKAEVSVELIQNNKRRYNVIWKKQLGEYALYNTSEKKNEQNLSLKGINTEDAYLVYTILYIDGRSGSTFKKQIAANLSDDGLFTLPL